jgi:hypothetical protein
VPQHAPGLQLLKASKICFQVEPVASGEKISMVMQVVTQARMERANGVPYIKQWALAGAGKRQGALFSQRMETSQLGCL